MTNIKPRTVTLPLVDEFGGRFSNAVITITLLQGATELSLSSVDGVRDYEASNMIGEIRYEAMYKYDPTQVGMTLRQLREKREVVIYRNAQDVEITEDQAKALKEDAVKSGKDPKACVTEEAITEIHKTLFVDLDDPAVVAAMQGQANAEEVMFRAVFADLQRRAKQ